LVVLGPLQVAFSLAERRCGKRQNAGSGGVPVLRIVGYLGIMRSLPRSMTRWRRATAHSSF
jgi:hypothetical protein